MMARALEAEGRAVDPLRRQLLGLQGPEGETHKRALAQWCSVTRTVRHSRCCPITVQRVEGSVHGCLLQPTVLSGRSPARGCTAPGEPFDCPSRSMLVEVDKLQLLLVLVVLLPVLLPILI